MNEDDGDVSSLLGDESELIEELALDGLLALSGKGQLEGGVAEMLVDVGLGAGDDTDDFLEAIGSEEGRTQ
jgi:hypothetical protein